MKSITAFLLTILIAFFLTSCKKGSVSTKNDAATIFGKWNVINESGFDGAGTSNHSVSYAGKTGDYFDFRKDGNIYIKEGTNLDTLSYQLTSDTTILIAGFGIILNGVPAISHINNLTAHNATINAPTVATPGGLFGRKVNLSR